MTVGFEVFVHDVIAAIATVPEAIVASLSPRAIRTGRYSRPSGTVPAVAPALPGGMAGLGGGSAAASDLANDGASLAGNDPDEDSTTEAWTTFGPPPPSPEVRAP